MLDNKLKKEKAIKLRKEGKTYSEILKEVSVAKSTLSEWFRDVGLSVPEKQRLTAKKLEAAKRGGIAKHAQRIIRTQKIHQEALKDITHISKRELWLIGVALYWAEGSKEKDYHPGGNLRFGNSDPRMIELFLKWLKEILKISDDRIGIEILIHENSKNNISAVKQYWSKVVGWKVNRLTKVYYKKTKIKTNRRNIGNLYYGGIRVTVKSSSSLVRQIAGWTEAVYRNI